MQHLPTADIVVILVYLLGITTIGVWTAKNVHSMGEFVMPRKFGKPMMVMFAFGAGTSSDQAVGVAAKTFTNGLSGIWYQWLWLFATPFYWLIAPFMRRFRANTTADVFHLRFDRRVAMLFAVVGMLQMSVQIGVMLKGSGSVIDAASGGLLPVNTAIWAMTIMFVIYGIAGGLSAAIVTDFIQGLLTILLSFILLPFIMGEVGGMAGIRENIHNPEMLSLVAPGEIGVFYIVVIALNALLGIVVQPHIMGACGAGRDETDGQVGFMGGNFIKRFCTIAWCLIGLAAVIHFQGREVHPDYVFGQVARDFLPRIMPGLLGIFLASLLASVMSSCDAFMISSAGLFAENIYKPLRPHETRERYLLVTRLVSIAVVALGVFFAYRLEDVVQGLEVFWKIAAMMAVPFWLGLWWRRTTCAGAWAATAAAFLVWLLTCQPWFIGWLAGLPFADSLRLIWETRGTPGVYIPWQMVFYLSAGLLAGVIVSLFTPRVPEEQLEQYYRLLRTPVAPGEVVEEPCTIPEGTPVPDVENKRRLAPNTDFMMTLPDRRGWLGFLVGWLLVAAIIGGFWWLVKG